MKRILIILLVLQSVVSAEGQSLINSNDFIIGLDSIPGTIPYNKNFLFFYGEKGAFRGGTEENSGLNYYSKDSIGYHSFGFGKDVAALYDNTIAIGSNITCKNPGAIAIGSILQSHGFGSVALGGNANAFGDQSFAISTNDAYGDGSFATGYLTETHGNESFTMGTQTIANGSSSLVIGVFNDTLIEKQKFYDTNVLTPLLIVGNGSSSTMRNNAMEVYNDGSVIFNPDETSRDMQIKWYDDGSDKHPLFQSSQDGWGYIGTYETEFKAVYANTIFANGVNVTSDRRLKSNIVPSKYGLEAIRSLSPVEFAYSKDPLSEHIGFIAQELAEVLPQLVSDRGNGYLSVNYIELIPVLVNGIKEQMDIINEQRDELGKLQDQLDDLKNQMVLIMNNLEANEKLDSQ